mgnify:FL=1
MNKKEIKRDLHLDDKGLQILSSMLVQDYLEHYNSKSTTFDNNSLAARVFCGAMLYATFVFGNSLMLGGAYQTNFEDKKKILEHLREITFILSKYEK